MVQPGSEAGSFQVGVGSGNGKLLARRYSSLSVSFSTSLMSVGRWYSMSSDALDSKSELAGELGGKK